MFKIAIGYHQFSGPYENTCKETDTCLWGSYSDNMPTVVVESGGYTTPYQHLLDDKDIWLTGGGAVNVVILVKWSLSQNRVSGFVEIWRKDVNYPLHIVSVHYWRHSVRFLHDYSLFSQSLHGRTIFK